MVQKYKDHKKATIKELESFTGHLNFINKSVVPGRTYTRRMYTKYSGENFFNSKGEKLKPYHHVKLDREFKEDCKMWEIFLKDPLEVNRPFIDLSVTLEATE